MTDTVKVNDQHHGDNWSLFNGDCVEAIRGMPESSIHLSIFSPPYSNLYVYSDSVRDIGNAASDDEFYHHFSFLIDELLRVMVPGRIVAVDCQNIPAMKQKDGYIGLKDFRGDLIWLFRQAGFIYHSEHCIWKDPLIEATRTKTVGLLHKQLMKDSTMCRAGLPQYLLAFRKPGDNPEPVAHPEGMTQFFGENGPTSGNLSHERWRRYASPVWTDINSSRTLNYRAARGERDERHICPMALDIIERAIWLWSNEGETVMDPFTGVGSTCYSAIKLNRRGIGFELKPSYFEQAVKNCELAEEENRHQRLF